MRKVRQGTVKIVSLSGAMTVEFQALIEWYALKQFGNLSERILERSARELEDFSGNFGCKLLGELAPEVELGSLSPVDYVVPEDKTRTIELKETKQLKSETYYLFDPSLVAKNGSWTTKAPRVNHLK